MRHALGLISALLTFSLNASALAAATPVKPVALPLWSDIDDLAKYSSAQMPDAPLLQAAMKKDPRFRSGNAQFKFSAHFEYLPQANLKSGTDYRAAALMSDNTGRLFYRKFLITVAGSPRQVTAVTIEKDINLADMHFQVNAGLIDRMVAVEDVENDVMLVFPLGVGGVDPAVSGSYHILTPQYTGATLKRSTVLSARTEPAYYRGRPFMPITNQLGKQTPIAFHITILSDGDWKAKGPNYLVRGFESHGCMRMREKDLLQFYTIVMKGGAEELPVTVAYFVWNRNEQQERDPGLGQVQAVNPYPVTKKTMMTVTNFGTSANPQARRDDEEHLLIMGRVNGTVDAKRLQTFSADELVDWKLFDGLTTDADPDLARAVKIH